jgi:Tol biopolymer transport system component
MGTNATSANQVYVYDFQTGSNQLVSAAFNAPGGAYGISYWPTISADGRFVAYFSFATNLTPGSYNRTGNVFLYDRTTGATTLVNASQVGSASANGPSVSPVFSGDSQTLFFQSWASDLDGGFFSSSAEIWALSLYSTNAQPVFSAAIGPAVASGRGPSLQWLTAPGKAYQAQYKNELSGPGLAAVVVRRHHCGKPRLFQ